MGDSMGPKNFENWKFDKILVAATSEAMIFNDFYSLAPISLLAALTYIMSIWPLEPLGVRVFLVPGCFAQIDINKSSLGAAGIQTWSS